MHVADPHTRRPAWPWLALALGVQAVVVVGLAVVLVGLGLSPAPPAGQRRPVPADELAAALGTALQPEEQKELGQLVVLGATGSQLALRRLEWRAAPADGPMHAVELVAEVQGPGWNLPVFVDGLFRHRWVAVVTEVDVAARPGAPSRTPEVAARVVVRLQRPPRIGPGLAARLGAPPEVDGDALRAEAQRASDEAYARALPRSRRLAERSRRAVQVALPALVRRAPQAPEARVSWRFEPATVEVSGPGP